MRVVRCKAASPDRGQQVNITKTAIVALAFGALAACGGGGEANNMDANAAMTDPALTDTNMATDMNMDMNMDMNAGTDMNMTDMNQSGMDMNTTDANTTANTTTP